MYRQRQEEESTIIEQQQESTFHLQSEALELLQQPSEEVDLEPLNQSCRGVKLVVDNLDTTIHPHQRRSD